MYDMYDYHLHSTHSGDGKVPDIVQAMAAIERGVKEICFTDHFDVDFPNAPTMDFEVDIPTSVSYTHLGGKINRCTQG